MALEYRLLKTLLSNSEYNSNIQNLSPVLFEDECRELYEVIVSSHTKHEQDLDTDTLFELWKSKNPIATEANISHMRDTISEVENSDIFSTSIASELIQTAWKKEAGRRISELGLNIIEGKEDAFNKLEVYLDKYKDGFSVTDNITLITKDINELLSSVSDEGRFQFNIKSLSDKVYGIGSGEFMIAYARPETGKTAFGISLACGPNGFCSQGANVLYLGNEEDPKRTMLRAIQSYAGMKKEEIILNPEDAVLKFNEISDNINMIGIQDWYIEDIEAYIRSNNYDIVIIDQADKIRLHDQTEGHSRLKEIYVQLRSLATKYGIAIVAICQASVDADHKTVLDPSMMEGSKTGKFAEGDLIIGIGKMDDNPDGSPNEIRYLNIGKNKITGWHGQIVCKLMIKISRYVD